uniref:Uncharacterized protein n=1 Tax=Glossina brevipalpis TaxID=37001 RepID=A0A1A9WQJ4_9MUSC
MRAACVYTEDFASVGELCLKSSYASTRTSPELLFDIQHHSLSIYLRLFSIHSSNSCITLTESSSLWLPTIPRLRKTSSGRTSKFCTRSNTGLNVSAIEQKRFRQLPLMGTKGFLVDSKVAKVARLTEYLAIVIIHRTKCWQISKIHLRVNSINLHNDHCYTVEKCFIILKPNAAETLQFGAFIMDEVRPAVSHKRMQFFVMYVYNYASLVMHIYLKLHKHFMHMHTLFKEEKTLQKSS